MSKLTPEQIRELSDKWLRGELKGAELRLFEEWYNQEGPDTVEWKKDADGAVLRERIFSGILRERGEGEVRRGPARAQVVMAWTVAASVLVVIVGEMLWSSARKKEVVAVPVAAAVKKDLAPAGNKAVLTLGDGSKIELDSATGKGVLAKLYKVEGNATGGGSGSVVYNTITTARGGQYQLALPDGTVVWLNAASSMRFPSSFSGKERVVEMTGEAYFKVVHNADQPFRVRVNGTEIEDIGTEFNVNSYADEQVTRTTLLEGAVKVGGMLLKPGQQAQLDGHAVGDGHAGVRVRNDVNTDEVVAWKNNRFYFKSADIRTIMRQIGRWYNVDVEYEGGISEQRFNAEIPRNTNASDILTALEMTGKVKFTITEKKITVQILK